MKKLKNYIILVPVKFKNITRSLSIIIFLFLLNSAGIFAQASFEIYGFRGDDKTDFWRYDISTDTWLLTAANANEAIETAPGTVKEGGGAHHRWKLYLWFEGRQYQRILAL